MMPLLRQERTGQTLRVSEGVLDRNRPEELARGVADFDPVQTSWPVRPESHGHKIPGDSRRCSSGRRPVGELAPLRIIDQSSALAELEKVLCHGAIVPGAANKGDCVLLRNAVASGFSTAFRCGAATS